MFIIAASVELNTSRQRLSALQLTRLQAFEGVPFLWVKTPRYSGNGIGRMINMLTYTLLVLFLPWLAQLPRPEVIIGSSVHPFAAWAGAILANRYKVPFIFEVRDLWPQTLIDLGALKPDGWVAACLRRLEKWLYLRAEKIITLLPHVDAYLKPLGVPEHKIAWVSNGVDLSKFPAAPARRDRGAFVLMYFGAHGNANCLEDLFYALNRLRNQGCARSLLVRLIGDGPLKPQLIALSKQLGLEFVSFEPPVPKQRVPELAAEADLFVVTMLDLPVYRFGISFNKIFDYLAAGRPIILAGNAINNPVQAAQAGITVPARDVIALANGIRALMEMSESEREILGRNARRYAEWHFDYPVLAQAFSEILDDVAKNDNTSGKAERVAEAAITGTTDNG